MPLVPDVESKRSDVDGILWMGVILVVIGIAIGIVWGALQQFILVMPLVCFILGIGMLIVFRIAKFDIREREEAEKKCVLPNHNYVDDNANLNTLYELCNNQIINYQLRTQSRASWSFRYAVASMIAGLAILIWAAWYIATVDSTKNQTVLPVSGIGVIGGAVSAYITKTFLDVHYLSLRQLNHYFRQPVLNWHILNAQRITGLLQEKEDKQKALEKIVATVVT